MFGRLGAGPAASIFVAFADPEPIVYHHNGADLAKPIGAVRLDAAAPAFDGPGATLRQVRYEIRKADVPARPTKRNSFAHRGRRWAIEDATSLDAVDAWLVTVSDAGAA